MKSSKKNRDKVIQNHIHRKLKPFIDEDLQLQLPAFNIQGEENFSYHPVYTHFVPDQSNENFLFSKINEKEMMRSIKEAEESFKAWNKMKEKLNQIKEKEESQFTPPYLA